MRTVIALQDGFYEARRIRKGEKFRVEDHIKGKWFVDEADYKPATPKPATTDKRGDAKREAYSFVSLMKRGPDADDNAPTTLSEAAARVGQTKADKALFGKK